MTPAQAVAPVWNFVPAAFDAGNLAAIEPLFAELERRPLTTIAELERFLLDESELHSRLGAELARRYIAMTCHTDQPETRDFGQQCLGVRRHWRQQGADYRGIGRRKQ